MPVALLVLHAVLVCSPSSETQPLAVGLLEPVGDLIWCRVSPTYLLHVRQVKDLFLERLELR